MIRKIITIIGARPQFIKAAAVSRAINEKFSDRFEEVLVHTGQHYDENMSEVFFKQLEIPEPKYNLEISGGDHGEMTGRMLGGIEKVLLKEKPDWVLVYGDTNSTLAGALAAAKLHIPVAHVEAGLRSNNMKMPEEINRILTDHISSRLFCPTELAVNNLLEEGLKTGVVNVGDVMYDLALFYGKKSKRKSLILERLKVEPQCYVLATCHRAENTDDLVRLKGILSALEEVSLQFPVVFPIHPRTRDLVKVNGLEKYLRSVAVIEPVSFLDMVALEKDAKLVLTDSGGVQKEAFFYQVPCVTMRKETEWGETVESGWNVLVDASKSKILSAAGRILDGTFIGDPTIKPFGDGKAAHAILDNL